MVLEALRVKVRRQKEIVQVKCMTWLGRRVKICYKQKQRLGDFIKVGASAEEYGRPPYSTAFILLLLMLF